MSDLIRKVDIDGDTLNCMVNCYDDLLDYFNGDDAILRDRGEFRSWLERMKWHALKCDELSSQVDELQKQKTAEWVPSFDGQFTGGAYWFHCSKCHHTIPGGLQSGYLFCSNCGARMTK